MPNNNPIGIGGFKKGQSGNPGGLKTRHIGDLSREARRYAQLGLSTLVKICRKAAGVYRGRKPSIDQAQVEKLRAEGLGATEIAKRLNIGRASVYRVLAS